MVLIVVASSCIPKRKLLYVQETKKDRDINEYTNVRPEKLIQPFDNIYIKVSSIDEKTNDIFSQQGQMASASNIDLISYTVNESGYINFPFVGEIYVKGMTLQDAQKKIEEDVGQYLTHISITVKFVNNTVSVLGEVRAPGEHIFYRDQITIFQAFSLAGGFSDYGDKEKVVLIREAKNKVNYYYLDLTEKEIVSSEFYYIIPNDVLIVKPINAKFRNLSLINVPIFLTTISTFITIYLLFYR
jgi:polysaccharide export outer membrane protein